MTAWRHAAYTFPCCGGRRWVDDENWQGDGRTERTKGDGLIPCGTCNFAGWETPENEPTQPWCVDCDQRWPCDAEQMRLRAEDAERRRWHHSPDAPPEHFCEDCDAERARTVVLETALRRVVDSEPADGHWDGWREVTRLRDIARTALAVLPDDRVGVEPLTFAHFAATNRARCEAPDGFGHPLSGWSLSDWFLAATGEFGEAANKAKKLNRIRDGIPGNTETEAELRAGLADEVADAVIYLDLLAQAAGFTLSGAVVSKFNRTSEKIGSPARLIASPTKGET